jgi:NAD-dependent SIR2 family protein deacetylase
MTENSRPQKHLTNIIKQMHDPKIMSRFVLFLGAGASVSSGVPAAQELVLGWRDQYEKIYGRKHESHGRQDEYSRLFEALYDKPSQRRECIEKIVSAATPSWGHIYLVNLMKNHVFNTIFTTNFDDLVDEACSRFTSDLRPIICAHDSSVKYIRLTASRPKIFKLHGDFLFDNIKNTSRELETLESNTRNKFKQFASEFGFIFLGYSGNDRSVMDVLNVLARTPGYFPGGIYWCKRRQDILSPSVEELARYAQVTIIEIEGFDEFCAELHAELELKLQDELRNPYECLTSKLNSLIEKTRINQRDEIAYVNHPVIKEDIGRLADHVETTVGQASIMPKLLIAQHAYNSGKFKESYRYAHDEISKNFSPLALRLCMLSAVACSDDGKVKETIKHLDEKWVKHLYDLKACNVLHDLVVGLIRAKRYGDARWILSIGEREFGPMSPLHVAYNWEFHSINVAQISRHLKEPMPDELTSRLRDISAKSIDWASRFGSYVVLDMHAEALREAAGFAKSSPQLARKMQFVADWPVCDLLNEEAREELRGILAGEIHS